jgi:hypothetical protein
LRRQDGDRRTEHGAHRRADGQAGHPGDEAGGWDPGARALDHAHRPVEQATEHATAHVAEEAAEHAGEACDVGAHRRPGGARQPEPPGHAEEHHEEANDFDEHPGLPRLQRNLGGSSPSL